MALLTAALVTNTDSEFGLGKIKDSVSYTPVSCELRFPLASGARANFLKVSVVCMEKGKKFLQAVHSRLEGEEAFSSLEGPLPFL